MPVLQDLPVARKFTYAFGAVCLLTLALGVTALIGFTKVNTATGDIVNNSMTAMRALGDMRFNAATIRRTEGYAVLCKGTACIQHYVTKRQDAIAAFRAAEAIYAPAISYPGEKELYASVSQNMTAHAVIGDKSIALHTAGKKVEALQALLAQDAHKTFDALAAAIASDVNLNNKMGSQVGADTIKMGHTLRAWVVAMMLFTVLMCVAIGIVLTCLIAPPLHAATRRWRSWQSKILRRRWRRGAATRSGGCRRRPTPASDPYTRFCAP